MAAVGEAAASAEMTVTGAAAEVLADHAAAVIVPGSTAPEVSDFRGGPFVPPGPAPAGTAPDRTAMTTAPRGLQDGMAVSVLTAKVRNPLLNLRVVSEVRDIATPDYVKDTGG